MVVVDVGDVNSQTAAQRMDGMDGWMDGWGLIGIDGMVMVMVIDGIRCPTANQMMAVAAGVIRTIHVPYNYHTNTISLRTELLSVHTVIHIRTVRIK